MMYNEFLAWSFQGNTDEYYSSMRWQGWEYDAKDTTINSAIFIYPFLWAKECDLEKASKKIINLDEIIEMNLAFATMAQTAADVLESEGDQGEK